MKKSSHTLGELFQALELFKAAAHTLRGGGSSNFQGFRLFFSDSQKTGQFFC